MSGSLNEKRGAEKKGQGNVMIRTQLALAVFEGE